MKLLLTAFAGMAIGALMLLAIRPIIESIYRVSK